MVDTDTNTHRDDDEGGPPPQSDDEHSAPVRVLVVDDHAFFRSVVDDYLREHPDLGVVSADEWTDETRARAEEFDPHVVVMDIELTAHSWQDTISRVRESLPQVGIIALALVGDQGYRQAAHTHGADAFVAKADAAVNLVPAIRRVAGHG